jgi:hypothetical protein
MLNGMEVFLWPQKSKKILSENHLWQIFRIFAPEITAVEWHRQYSFRGKLKRNASVLYHRIWKIQFRARRSATVRAYAWVCRLIVFSNGFPEPGDRDVGLSGPRSLYPRKSGRKKNCFR